MRWKGARKSEYVEDRRRSTGGGKLALGGLGGVVVLLIALFFGGDPSELINQFQDVSGGQALQDQPLNAEEEALGDFASVVFASTEDVWTQLFLQAGKKYRNPHLIMYRGGTNTGGCGFGEASFGPFYCPADERVYLDLSFNEELKNRFEATGEFALAYVIAHEVGHHIQTIFGVLQQVQQQRDRLSESEFNKLMVKLELQADFYAGVWAHHASEWSGVELTYSDIQEGIKAASAVGDDQIQLQSRGYVVPESFTHGTAEQRSMWFKKGFDTGDLSQGDTFNDPRLN